MVVNNQGMHCSGLLRNNQLDYLIYCPPFYCKVASEKVHMISVEKGLKAKHNHICCQHLILFFSFSIHPIYHTFWQDFQLLIFSAQFMVVQRLSSAFPRLLKQKGESVLSSNTSLPFLLMPKAVKASVDGTLVEGPSLSINLVFHVFS